jgi:hypothetical protein
MAVTLASAHSTTSHLLVFKAVPPPERSAPVAKVNLSWLILQDAALLGGQTLSE